MKRPGRILARLLWRLVCFLVRRAARLAWRLARRYRWELAPLGLLAVLLAAGLAVHTFAPGYWWTLPAAVVAGGAVTMWRACDRRAEYAYAAAVSAVLAGWVWWFTLAPTEEAARVLLYGGPLLAGPWWWHYRRRFQVRRLLLRWSQAVEAAGLTGVRLSKRLHYDAFGWTATVTHPGKTTAQLTKAADQLESSLRLRRGGLRIEPTDRAWQSRIRVTSVDLRRGGGIPMPTPTVRTITRPVPVGMTEDGKARELLLFGKHVICAGTNGSGKSGTQRVILASLLAMRDVEVFYIDLKAGGVEARLWTGGIPARNIATTVEQAKELLNRAVARMDTHGQLMERHAMGSHFKPSRRHRALVVVIDEGSDLIAAGLDAQLNTLFEKGRAVGVWLHYATQYVIAQTLTTRMVANTRVKLGHRVTNRRESEQVYGQGSGREGWRADRLPSGGGWMQVWDDGEVRQERVRAYRVNDDDIPRLIDAAQLGQEPADDEDQGDEPTTPSVPDDPAPADQDEQPPADSAGHDDEDQGDDPAARTLAAIRSGARTVPELVKLTETSRATVNRHLSELLQGEAIRRVGRGQYEAVTTDGA